MLGSDENYYKAYDKRYKQVYENGMLWTSNENTKDVMDVIEKYHISNKSKILDLGCGEGRDAIYLLNNGYNVLGLIIQILLYKNVMNYQILNIWINLDN